MDHAHHAPAPIGYEALSALSFRKVTGKERASLLQLLTTTRKEGLLFLMEHGERDDLVSPQGSTVEAFDPQQSELLLAYSADALFEQQLENAGVMLIVELDEGILQLEFEAVVREQVNGENSLRCRLPDALLLIQRRQARRVPVGAGVQFSSAILNAYGGESVTVEDLSDLGIGLMIQGEPKLEAGMVLSDCHLTLSELGQVDLQVMVKGVSVEKEGAGHSVMMVGALFVGLAASTRALIQRYTFQCDLEARKRMDVLDNLMNSSVVAGEPVVKPRY
ncbi:MAG: hypothetical protein HOL04_05025 [Gammaproteobacteria bacterium]|jgi:c-di-GMP-binding flagellar brake protein YcgR|nr:hypothetical protein [Gammaproteobacteria bacterium]MBT4607295.1 hypothetical protein [Thiotrichales bacterium]MBT3473860.1 hypothetical protein [Gammaproteobacteria bacterium]MBT3892544.1 hypothetical protein [Gammaproteobacteria bacterium]MBT3966190.1 hypothetical protein [Gammaproteobacteria bacterium]